MSQKKKQPPRRINWLKITLVLLAALLAVYLVKLAMFAHYVYIWVPGSDPMIALANSITLILAGYCFLSGVSVLFSRRYMYILPLTVALFASFFIEIPVDEYAVSDQRISSFFEQHRHDYETIVDLIHEDKLDRQGCGIDARKLPAGYETLSEGGCVYVYGRDTSLYVAFEWKIIFYEYSIIFSLGPLNCLNAAYARDFDADWHFCKHDPALK